LNRDQVWASKFSLLSVLITEDSLYNIFEKWSVEMSPDFHRCLKISQRTYISITENKDRIYDQNQQLRKNALGWQ